MLFISAGSALFAFLKTFCFTMLEQRFSNNLRKQVFSKFLKQDIEFFDENKTGELVSRLTHDCNALKSVCTG